MTNIKHKSLVEGPKTLSPLMKSHGVTLNKLPEKNKLDDLSYLNTLMAFVQKYMTRRLDFEIVFPPNLTRGAISKVMDLIHKSHPYVFICLFRKKDTHAIKICFHYPSDEERAKPGLLEVRALISLETIEKLLRFASETGDQKLIDRLSAIKSQMAPKAKNLN